MKEQRLVLPKNCSLEEIMAHLNCRHVQDGEFIEEDDYQYTLESDGTSVIISPP